MNKVKKRINAEIGKSVASFNGILKDLELRMKVYKLFFSGKSFDFEGYREYTNLDDSSLIDWKATMRSNKNVVRKYKEEEDLRVLIVFDVGNNMVFGSSKKLKCEYAAEVAASIAFLVANSGNKLGFAIYNKEIVKFANCKKGKNQFNLFCDLITDASVYKNRSSLSEALKFILKNPANHMDSVIIISDFSSFNEATEKSLERMSTLSETICISIRDPLDKSLPNISHPIAIESPEGNSQIIIDPHTIGNAYKKKMSIKDNKMEAFFARNRIDYLEILTNKPFSYSLANFLKKRRSYVQVKAK